MASRFTLQSDGGIIELQASVDDLILQSDSGAAPFVTTTDARRPYRVDVNRWQPQNLLLTTLAPLLLVPFAAADANWQVKRTPPPVSQWQPANPLLPLTVYPFRQPDWQTPTRTPQRDLEHPQNLLPLRVVVAPAAPFIPMDLSDTRLQPRSRVKFSLLVRSALEVKEPRPFAVNWPQARIPQVRRAAITDLNLLTSQLGIVVERQPIPFRHGRPILVGAEAFVPPAYRPFPYRPPRTTIVIGTLHLGGSGGPCPQVVND